MSDIDLEKYRRHVDHFDMPEDKKTELLKAVWRIMQSFVDRAFGDDPVQQVRRLEGQAAGGKSDAKDASDSMAVLDSNQPETGTSREDQTGSLRGTNDAGGGKR